VQAEPKSLKKELLDDSASDRHNKASAKATVNNNAYDKNRIEVLRLLLACCSEQVRPRCERLGTRYERPNVLQAAKRAASLLPPAHTLRAPQLFVYPHGPNETPPDLKWMAVTCSADAPNAPALFFSLLNTVLGYDPIGIGIPYGGVVGGSIQRRLFELSSQVLICLLDFGRAGNHEGKTDPLTGYPFVDLADSKVAGYNVFRTLLARMSGEYELTYVRERASEATDLIGDSA